MLCTGKSGSSNNWLDKLRSSKGFPDGNGHDLEHFLNPNPNSDYDVNLEKNDPKSSSDLEEKGVVFRSVTNSKPHQQSSTMEKEELFDIMSSVLAELFNMGGDSEKIRGFDKKKSSRKQSNPRICVTSGSASVDDCCLNEARKSAMSPSSADNSVIEEKRIGDQNRLKKKQGSIVVAVADVVPLNVDDEKMKVDYSGYSRADVMVIDTSASVWKSEKIVFRKGSVWKVCDKKSKCRRVFGTRKRKNNPSDDSEGGGNKKKKKKKKKKQKLSLIPSSINIKEAAVHEKCLMLSNERCPPDSAMGATFNPNHVLELRHKFSRSARKPSKSGSSVFPVQDVPTNRKNGVQLLKNCP